MIFIFLGITTGSTHNDLLDILRNDEQLTGNEKVFYEDQKGARLCHLSEEVDTEYEVERLKSIQQIESEAVAESETMQFINPVEYIEVISTPPPRSGRKRQAEECTSDEMQTPPPALPLCSPPSSSGIYKSTPRRDVRKGRNVDIAFKDTIATVSYRTALSVQKARVAVQAVCEKLYGHQYYLSIDEQNKFKSSLDSIAEEEEVVNQPQDKKPRRKEQYQQYKLILPSAKVVSDFKHEKAMHQEITAGKALSSVTRDIKVTLHFDTTGRSRVDGEWPALILNFLSDVKENCQMFRLRAIFFAYEDREQITKLIVETLERLAVAAATTKLLWENVFALMTDSVTKNLQVENKVATELKSDHIPIHILCKSHVCEKLDESCVNALVKIESEIKIAELIIKRQPRLKSFVRQSKCLVMCAIKALMKLVSNEESAKPTSLAKEFDIELEKDGQAKSLSLYKERRFTKLGYTAGAILECLPQFNAILEQTTKCNMLTEACKLYLECDYIIAALKSLANFTYKVTMPYLNCIEKSDQNDLINILETLYKDLLDGKTDTLSQFKVPWTHVNMSQQTPTSPLDYHLLNSMCIAAAEGIRVQCAREYWAEDENPQATQLHKLSYQERKNLPTENLSAERYLAKFGYLVSVSASKSNKFFKAKRIQDDMMFNVNLTVGEEEVTKLTKRVTKILKEMELQWTASQKHVWKTKVKEAMNKKVRNLEYKDLLLRKCKQHGGPFVNLSEVRDFVNQQKDDSKQLRTHLRQEIGFQKLLHPVDAKERPHLYKMNELTCEQLTENITILLDSTIDATEEEVLFPNEDDIMEILNEKSNDVLVENTAGFQPQQPLAVIWNNDDGSTYWAVGFFMCDVEDEFIKVDHLELKAGHRNDKMKWIRPLNDDMQIVNPIQILPCEVSGEWDFKSARQPVYILNNVDVIESVFKCDV